MKEVERKDVPAISGGGSLIENPLPTTVLPYPTYPQVPAGPLDPSAPALGGVTGKNQEF